MKTTVDVGCNGRQMHCSVLHEYMPRVLLWTDSDVFAGTEKHACELEQGLRGMGVQVRMACPHPSPLSVAVSGRGGVVFPLRCKGLRALFAVLRVRRWLLQGRVELIHAHNGCTTFLAALACILARRGTLVATQHFIHPARTRRRGLSRWISQRLHGWISRRVDRWIAVSEAVRRAMLSRREVSAARIGVVPNGVSRGGETLEANRRVVRGLMRCDPGEVVLVCVARLEEEKGHQTLLNALAILRSEGQRFSAWMVGAGNLREALERRVQELGLSDSVFFAGHQADPGPWMDASDVVVLPSPEEPFGLVLLEAMSRCKPVVAARAGGPCEIVEDQRTGLLFEPMDPRDLAFKLRSLLERERLRGLMGKAGLERWRACFTAERMSASTLEVYREALRGDAIPAPWSTRGEALSRP